MMSESGPVGRFCSEDGLEWFRIDQYDLLDPFMISIITSHDQWLFVSSSGALTAGRRSAEQALFPYETEDRLHRGGGQTGPVTVIRIEGADEVWEPFAPHTPAGKVRRSIAKTVAGDRLRFEEHHPGLGLAFRYTWSTAPELGLVRSCELVRDEPQQPVTVWLLDGLVDVLPAGVELSVQQTSSTLVDAYRRSEYEPDSGLALFTLEALISDRPDPAESLSASVVWSVGLENATTALSDRQIRRFRSGEKINPEHLVTGRKGAFLLSTTVRLEAGSPLRWMMVADVGQDHVGIANLRQWLGQSSSPEVEVEAAVEAAHGELMNLVGAADAHQETADRRISVSHFANVLYNCSRGGVPVDSHRVEVADISRFIASRNRPVHARLGPLVEALEPVVELDVLRGAVAGDVDLSRLVSEYLPLVFSRRHGDPTRPWNSFHIGIGSGGEKAAHAYEGNWRDIFQNWEALVHSFPGYAESVVAKFLNASTMDGHNPYRITNEGIDWEVPEDGSWSNFGYWGDHQIVYLHRLLDAVQRFHPGRLEEMLHRQLFSYANVPYRILPYGDIVADPKHTLEFDLAEQEEIDRRVESIGSDGKLVFADDGGVLHASLAEKLLVPALAKLSNLVSGGGIWLNTQRPEWNDANNALVGFGVSVVTAFHLSEYLAFVDGLLERSPVAQVPINQSVLDWLREVESALDTWAALAEHREISAQDRRNLLDQLGDAFSVYRRQVYNGVPKRSSASSVGISELRQFLGVAKLHLDIAATSAHRPDGLVDAYRLLRLAPGVAELEPLYLMLEGQVAAISSSCTELDSVVGLMNAAFESELYRPDQESFLLYPNSPRLPFMQKNQIPGEHFGPAMGALADSGQGIIHRDADGIARFGSHLQCAQDLVIALDGLDDVVALDDTGRSEVLNAYEAVFNHRGFTGRSQTMYRYEGLGSVYWHMVAKLLLALQERLIGAIDSDEDETLVGELFGFYRRVRAGLGPLKPVAAHGAFPTDPHSHTPTHSGAQQPGMTGAVKEGVLLRWGELGIRVEAGSVGFHPVLLDEAEFLVEPRPWSPLGSGEFLEANTIGFTYCGVPVVYHRQNGTPWTRVTWADGSVSTGGNRLDRESSHALFARDGSIKRIDAGVQARRLDRGENWA